MREALDRQHVLEHGPWCAWCQQCNTTCSADNKASLRRQRCYACKIHEMHLGMVTAQERHCHASTEEAERCAPPLDCWLMTPLPEEVVMGNLHDVA